MHSAISVQTPSDHAGRYYSQCVYDEVCSLHVVVHAISEPVVVRTHALTLGLMRTKPWVDWLQIPLESSVSSWSVGHGIGVVSKDAEALSICMVVEWIDRGWIMEHLGRVDVRWNRRTTSSLLLSWLFGPSIFLPDGR